MNLKDRMNCNLPVTTPKQNVSQMDLVQKQKELIQNQELTIQTLQSEKRKLEDELVNSNEKVVKLNEEIVMLNEKITNLSQSDKELSESIRIRDAAAKEREDAARDLQKASWEREKSEEQNRKNREEDMRLSEWKVQLQRDQRSQSEIVLQKVEQEMERKKKIISFRIAKEWYSSVMLIVYSLVMTLFFIVTHWEIVLTGDVFFTRLVNVIRGIWEVVWPAVYGYWFEQFQADTGSLIATIITAVLCAGALFGLTVLFRKWKHSVDSAYEEKDKRKVEMTVLITVASLVLSLIICSHTNIEISWIMLWILISAGSIFFFQTIRLIWVKKYKSGHKW